MLCVWCDQRHRFWFIGAGDIQPQQVDAEHKRGRLLKLGNRIWELRDAWHVLPIPKEFIACCAETRGVGRQIHRRLFQVEEREWRQRDVGIWLEKCSNWRMGLSIIERSIWNCLLPLCPCWKHYKTTRSVCAQAGERWIPYELRFLLVFHRRRWRHRGK